jgi:hypothetical protein
MSQSVYAMSISRGHGPARSAQVTLDVFVQAWQQAPTFEPKAESAWTWVRTIALEEIDSQSKGALRPRSSGTNSRQQCDNPEAKPCLSNPA